MGEMQMNQSICHPSKYSEKNAERRKLAQKYLEDPSDTESLEKLFKLVHPIANHVMHEHRRLIPSMDKNDYMQIADITVWRVLKRMQVKPDILNYFEAYLRVSIRHSYISEFRKYAFKSFFEYRSFEQNGNSLNISYMYHLDEYVQRILSQKREYNKKYRAEHHDEILQKSREYYHRTIERRREYRRAYNAAHKDAVRQYHRTYYEKNKNKLAEKKREYMRRKREDAKVQRESGI